MNFLSRLVSTLPVLVLAATASAQGASGASLSGEPAATAGQTYAVTLPPLPDGVASVYVHFDDGDGAGGWHDAGQRTVTHVFDEPARLRVIRAHYEALRGGGQIALEPLRIEVKTADGESLKPPPPPPVVVEPLPLDQQRVGLNLTAVNYYTEAEPFVNRMREFSAWKPERRKADGGWEASDAPLELRADGMPARLAPGERAYALRDFPQCGVSGPHTLTWEGEGRLVWGLRPRGEAKPDGFQAMRINLPERPTRHVRVMLILTQTNPSDPVRNLRLVRDGADPQATFAAAFLERWAWADGFRYMDWGCTNGSTLSHWEDRPEPGDWTWATDDGVPLEVQIAHANATGADPWFCVPVRADDDYIQKMAELLRDTLDENLVATVELSNEVWNWAFPQTRYADEQGRARGITDAPHLQWYVQRSLEMFAIFDGAFGGRSPRLRRVISSQSSNPWVATKLFETDAAVNGADALAIAPYFGGKFGEDRADAFRAADGPWLDAEIDRGLAGTLRGLRRYPAVLAAVNGRRDPTLPPIVQLAYEGGGHFLPPPGSERDADALAVFNRLGRRDEMADAYRRYLAGWHELGGADLMLFSSMGNPTHWGDWGLVRHAGQPLSDTPKLRGVMEYLQEQRAGR